MKNKKWTAFVYVLSIVIMLTCAGLFIFHLTKPASAEEVPAETQEEPQGLKEKLWFLDETVYQIIVSAVGSLGAIALVAFNIIRSIKGLKDATKKLGADSEEAIGKRAELEKYIRELQEIKGKLTDDISGLREEIARIIQMEVIAFCNDPNLVKNGQAREIAKIGGEERGIEG